MPGLFVKNKNSENSKTDFLVRCLRSQNPVLILKPSTILIEEDVEEPSSILWSGLLTLRDHATDH